MGRNIGMPPVPRTGNLSAPSRDTTLLACSSIAMSLDLPGDPMKSRSNTPPGFPSTDSATRAPEETLQVSWTGPAVSLRSWSDQQSVSLWSTPDESCPLSYVPGAGVRGMARSNGASTGSIVITIGDSHRNSLALSLNNLTKPPECIETRMAFYGHLFRQSGQQGDDPGDLSPNEAAFADAVGTEWLALGAERSAG